MTYKTSGRVWEAIGKKKIKGQILAKKKKKSLGASYVYINSVLTPMITIVLTFKHNLLVF